MITTDGTIYGGSDDGNLYAIHTRCGGVAPSAWTMFHQNPEHTGVQPTPE